MSAILSDTNVLVASAVEDHPHHLPSLELIEKLRREKITVCMALHSVAECFSALTSLPREDPISASQALTLINASLLKNLEVVTLDFHDYREALQRVAKANLQKGAVYDALIFQAALKKQVPVLVTWNLKHFERLSKGELKIRTPSQFVESV